MRPSFDSGLSTSNMHPTISQMEPRALQCQLCLKLTPYSPSLFFHTLGERRKHAHRHISRMMPSPFITCFPNEFKRSFTTKTEMNDSYATDNTESTEQSKNSSIGNISAQEKLPRVLEVVIDIENEPVFKKQNTTQNQTFESTRHSEETSFSSSLGRKDYALNNDKPKYLAWINFFSRLVKEGFTGPCQFPGCQLVVKRNHSPFNHITAHFRKPQYACALCGIKAQLCLTKHFRDAHPGQRVQSQDLRLEHEEELRKITLQSYPILRDCTVIWQGKEPLQLNQLFHSLAKVGVAQSCQYKGCRSSVDPFSWDLQRHVLGHFETPLFNCNLCRYEGNAIVEHSIQAHNHIGVQRTENLKSYEDHRPQYETTLLNLANICFPNNFPLDSVSVEPMEKTIGCDGGGSTLKRGRSMEKVIWNQDTPTMRILRAETSILVAFLRNDNGKSLLCQYKGCGRQLKCNSSSAFTTVLQHMLTHANSIVEECSVCGFKSKYSVKSHFRQEHPEIEMIDFIDLRPNVAHIINDRLRDSFPQISHAQKILKSINCGEGLDLLWSTLQAKVGRELFCAECGVEVGSGGTWPLLLHLLSHYPTPLFRCQRCRYQGNDIFNHFVDSHFVKMRFEMQYEDDLKCHEDQLVNLVKRLFP